MRARSGRRRVLRGERAVEALLVGGLWLAFCIWMTLVIFSWAGLL